MPRFTWHKQKCTGCPNVERYRGKARLGELVDRCTYCHSPLKVIAIHWGPEKYAQGRNGQVDKLQ